MFHLSLALYPTYATYIPTCVVDNFYPSHTLYVAPVVRTSRKLMILLFICIVGTVDGHGCDGQQKRPCMCFIATHKVKAKKPCTVTFSFYSARSRCRTVPASCIFLCR